MTNLTIAMPAALRQWIDARVAEGRYANAADYVRDLIRRDLDAGLGDADEVRASLIEGLDSGILSDSPEAIVEAIIAERPDQAA